MYYAASRKKLRSHGIMVRNSDRWQQLMKNNKRRTPQLRKRRANRLRERFDATLSGIIDISRILSSNLDLDTIWDALHDHISITFDTSSFFIALYDYERDQLVFPLV